MRFWAPISAALHIACVLAIIGLVFGSKLVDPALYLDEAAKGHYEAITVASQLGRFDLISAILGMFGVLVGLAAIFGFIEVRTGAREAARAAA